MIAGLVLICCQSVSPAMAQGLKQADVNAAVEDFKNGKYSSALTAFRVILPATTDPEQRADILWNIARSLEELDRPRDALGAFERFAAETKRGDAKDKITKLTALVFGTIAVQCAGRAVTVRLEGHDGEPRPCPTVFQRVQPGSVVVIGVADGTEQARSVAKVSAGQSVDVNLVAPKATETADVAESSSSMIWAVGGAALLIGAGVGLYFLLEEQPPADEPSVRIYVSEAEQSLLRR